jgi:hypothetical protein
MDQLNTVSSIKYIEVSQEKIKIQDNKDGIHYQVKTISKIQFN